MKFKKLPLALAAVSALTASLAMGQTVQVYGKLYPYLVHESGSGPSAVGTPVSTLAPAASGLTGVPTIRGMSSGNSYIGFRGTEDMGGGLKAIYELPDDMPLMVGTPRTPFGVAASVDTGVPTALGPELDSCSIYGYSLP